MELTLWTYEGPPHVGAMRIATSMSGLHYVLHAPQGDTYADLLFTMIERRSTRPPVTYTTFEARDLGGDTAELFKTAVRDAYERWAPQAMLVGASCTAELLQDDPGGLARALRLPIPVIPLELPAYQKKENWGASETFYRLVQIASSPASSARVPDARPRCNILGPTALGFRHRDDVREISGILDMARRGDLRHGAARRDARGHHSSRRGRLQRRALSRDRPTCGEMVGNEPFEPTVHQDHSHRRRRNARFHRRSRRTRRGRSPPQRSTKTRHAALVFALGRFDLSHRQARLHLRRRHARDRSRARSREPNSASRSSGSEPTSASSPASCASAAEACGVEALITDDYLEVEAQGRRTAAGTGSRHPDGAPHRQAARNSLRRDLGTGARSGLPGPLLPADGFRRRERDVRLPGFIR